MTSGDMQSQASRWGRRRTVWRVRTGTEWAVVLRVVMETERTMVPRVRTGTEWAAPVQKGFRTEGGRGGRRVARELPNASPERVTFPCPRVGRSAWPPRPPGEAAPASWPPVGQSSVRTVPPRGRQTPCMPGLTEPVGRRDAWCAFVPGARTLRDSLKHPET